MSVNRYMIELFVAFAAPAKFALHAKSSPCLIASTASQHVTLFMRARQWESFPASEWRKLREKTNCHTVRILTRSARPRECCKSKRQK
jgi:hypothetical protein